MSKFVIPLGDSGFISRFNFYCIVAGFLNCSSHVIYKAVNLTYLALFTSAPAKPLFMKSLLIVSINISCFIIFVLYRNVVDLLFLFGLYWPKLIVYVIAAGSWLFKEHNESDLLK